MRSIGQVQRHGKGKDVRASAAASGLPTEEIDSTVALIQALIPLGLQAVGEALAAEVTALARGLWRHAAAEMLAAQNREHPQQRAEVDAAKDEGGAARYLAGGDEGKCRASL